MAGFPQGARARLIEARPLSLDIAREWRGSERYQSILRRFEGERATPESLADAAESLLAGQDWAALLDPLLAALAAHPMIEPPFRVSRDAVRTGAVLVDAPRVSISASVLDGRALPRPATIVFPGYITVTRYLKAGGATLRRWEADALTADFTSATAAPCRPLASVALHDGAIHRCDGRTRAQFPADANGTLIPIVATIRLGAATLIREHRIADGALVRVASADEAASRTEMLLAFLRHSGRVDAGPRFDAASRDSAFHTRWAAMREWLGLDARAALPRLTQMAEGDPHPEVRTAATTTLARIACPA